MLGQRLVQKCDANASVNANANDVDTFNANARTVRDARALEHPNMADEVEGLVAFSGLILG